MPTDKIKTLDKFPEWFSSPLEQGRSEYFLGAHPTREQAKSFCRKYRCFLRSLAASNNPLKTILQDYTCRLYITEKLSAAYNEKPFWVYCIVKRKLQLKTATGEIL